MRFFREDIAEDNDTIVNHFDEGHMVAMENIETMEAMAIAEGPDGRLMVVPQTELHSGLEPMVYEDDDPFFTESSTGFGTWYEIPMYDSEEWLWREEMFRRNQKRHFARTIY